MGSLRTIFAITVVLAHSSPGGMIFVGGRNAVQCFYIISGFLISYVLVEKRAYSGVKYFYINRYLRLYPIYFCVAVLTLLVYTFYSSIGSHELPFFSVYARSPFSANVLLIFSNVLLFGQDWVLFAGIKDHALVFTQNFLQSDVALYPGLIVPQAWTLGLELTFYLIAPFVLPKRKWLYFLLAVSVGVRVYLIATGLGLRDPWTYRFFPAELALFLLGALSHQILLPLYRAVPANRLTLISNVATYSLMVLAVLYFAIPARDMLKTLFLFSSFILLLPLAFLFQNRHRADRWIGDLSYPIYIGHVLVIFLCENALKTISVQDPYVLSMISVILTICFAILLNQWIGKPFESVRSRFREPGDVRLRFEPRAKAENGVFVEAGRKPTD